MREHVRAVVPAERYRPSSDREDRQHQSDPLCDDALLLSVLARLEARVGIPRPEVGGDQIRRRGHGAAGRRAGPCLEHDGGLEDVERGTPQAGFDDAFGVRAVGRLAAGSPERRMTVPVEASVPVHVPVAVPSITLAHAAPLTSSPIRSR